MTRALPSLFLLCCVTLAASSAQAKTRVTIHEFFGPHANTLRADAEQILKDQQTLELVSKEEIDAASHSLGIDVLSPAGRRTISRELRLSAWVTGMVRKRADGLHLTVVVYDGADHASVGRTVLVARNAKMLQGALKRKLWRNAKDAIFLALAPLPPGRGVVEPDSACRPDLPTTSTPPGAASAPPENAETHLHPTSSAAVPEASSSPPPVPAPAVVPGPAVAPALPPAAVLGSSFASRNDAASFAPTKKRRTDALRVALGMGSPYRKLSYSDAVTNSLGDYQLSGMPMLDLNLAYYPGQSFTDGWASWLGLDLAGQFAIGGGANTDRDGNRFRAHYDAYRVGARVRMPLRAHFISAFSGYAIQRVSFSSDTKGAAAPTPDVDYRMVRTGAGSELRLTQALGLSMELAWLHVLSVGEVGNWFPRATAGGLEAALSFSYALGHRLFARASGAYQRVAYDFHVQPGDAKIAGGATDQILTASLGIGVGI